MDKRLNFFENLKNTKRNIEKFLSYSMESLSPQIQKP